MLLRQSVMESDVNNADSLASRDSAALHLPCQKSITRSAGQSKSRADDTMETKR